MSFIDLYMIFSNKYDQFIIQNLLVNDNEFKVYYILTHFNSNNFILFRIIQMMYYPNIFNHYPNFLLTYIGESFALNKQIILYVIKNTYNTINILNTINKLKQYNEFLNKCIDSSKKQQIVEFAIEKLKTRRLTSK